MVSAEGEADIGVAGLVGAEISRRVARAVAEEAPQTRSESAPARPGQPPDILVLRDQGGFRAAMTSSRIRRGLRTNGQPLRAGPLPRRSLPRAGRRQPREGPSRGPPGQATAVPVVHFYAAAPAHSPAAIDRNRVS